MACDYDHDLSKVLKSAYETAPKRRAVPAIVRALPGVVRWFSRTDHQQRCGYTQALDDLEEVSYAWAQMDHGSAAQDSYVLKDRRAFLEALLAAFPAAVPASVLSE